MLKAVVVYMQGTGGNLLSRSLCLANNTISPLPIEYADQQPRLDLDKQEKFKIYNNWNAHDWTQTEKEITIWYHSGRQDFVNYEQSNMYLIDQFHPADFEKENSDKILWNNLSQWSHVILITWQQQSLDLIRKLARLKRTDLNHSLQLPKEIKTYQQILSQHSGLTVAWENMLQKSTYQVEVEKLALALDLDLDLDLVGSLWDSWKQSTDMILSNE